MNPEFRGWLASLTFAAIATLSHPAWTAGVVDQSSPGPQASAPGHSNAEGADIPVIPAPQGSGAAAGGPPSRADANANGISDSLETLIDQGGPGEKFDVIVVFSGPDAPGDARAAVARSHAAVGQFAVTRAFSIINGFQASMTAAQIHALSSAPGVFRIQENGEVRAFDNYSNDDTGATDARALASGTYTGTGAGVTVCIIDTGINAAHEQFSEGDVSRITGFADFVNGQTSPYDDQGHGTHVAGIVAGDGLGSHSAAGDAMGVAPGAYIKAAKVLDANGSGTEADVIAGIQWCAGTDDPTNPENTDVSIISLSLGGPGTDGTDPLSLAANCAADPSVDSMCGSPAGGPKIVVIAAGNSGAQPGTIGTPGVAEKAITVGSFAEWSGDQGDIWQDDGVYLNPFSSRGPVSDGRIKPDIAAPGSWVLSAYIGSNGEQSPTAYAAASGTSMATPFVSGVIALMLDANSSLGSTDGGLPHEKVRDILMQTAVDRGGDDDVGDASGKDNEYGWGLIDAYAAVNWALGASGYMPTEYPGYTRVADAQVDPSSNWYYPDAGGFLVEDLQTPIAATMTIKGGVACYLACWFATYWDPDLELVAEFHNGTNWEQVKADDGPNLDDPTLSAEKTLSTCPDSGECGGIGRVEHVHFIPNKPGQYRFRVYPYAGSPNDGKGGKFDFEISMGAPTSGGGGGGNNAPVAVDDSYTTDEDIQLTVGAAAGVLANDSDADNELLTAAAVAGPSNGTLALSADGSFTYTPNPNFNGSDSFTYKANDGTADSNTATVSIAVNAVNNAPVAADDSYTTDEDKQLTVEAAGVLANDSDVDNEPLTAAAVAGPSNGTLALSADGSFTYTPNPNFNGSDSFTYKANDGTADSNTATVSIAVNAVNDAPVAVDDSYATDQDVPLSVAAPGVLGNDSDVDNDPLEAVLASEPSNGSLALSGDGSFTYTPNTGFTGTDSFTYQAKDSAAILSDVATVSITVNQASTPVTMHVGDLDSVSINQGRTWDAIVTVTVHDSNENPLQDVAVNGTWSNGASGNTSCSSTTDANGQCTVSYGGLRKNNSFVTFTVTNVSGDSLTYEAEKNHDDEGDSTGTSIDVPKP